VQAQLDARAEWLPLPAGTTVQAASSLDLVRVRLRLRVRASPL